MKILGIDTILHDACAAVVENGDKVCSNIVKHSILNSNRLLDMPISHLGQIGPVISKALETAKCEIRDINAVAVNNFGSMFSNVLIGVSTASTLANIYNLPLIPVNHQEAHMYSNWLERDFDCFRFPILVFSASGGHSSVALLKKNNFKPAIITSIDGMKEKKEGPDFKGVGALYGFVAYNLGLGGKIDSGKAITKAAQYGDDKKFIFKSLNESEVEKLNFSFLEKEIEGIIDSARGAKNKALSDNFIKDFTASFQKSLTDKICDILINVAKGKKAKEIHLAGGISANSYLRKKLDVICRDNNLVGRSPAKKEFSTDNAAMIASLGYYRYKLSPRKYQKQRSVKIISNLKLEQIAIKQYLDNKQELC